MKPTTKLLLVLFAGLLFSSCCTKPTEKTANEKAIFGVWAHGSEKRSDSEWVNDFKKCEDADITDIFILAGADELRRYVALAKGKDIRIHGWVWVMNQPGDTVAAKHKDWYAVNRKGDNSYDQRPYVDYYQWLSPFSPGARKHILNKVKKIAEVEGLATIHLDYVRFCDVILGAQLQPVYGLVQDHEMPEYDFGYHPNARKGFKEIFGRDPLDMKNPELSAEWRQYRMNAITSLVDEIADMVHGKGRKLSAAVFPFPEMSASMVRQDWATWKLDIVCPMNYNSFYNEGINWIGFSVKSGIRYTKGRAKYYSGLYVPAIAESGDFEGAVEQSLKAGANGVCFFELPNLTTEHLKLIKKLKDRYNKRDN